MNNFYPFYNSGMAEEITSAARQVYRRACRDFELDIGVVEKENTKEIANALNDLFDRASYKSIIERTCSCGGKMSGEGRLATGKKLRNGYQPQVNEVLEVFFIQCETCGHWEDSQ